jgi:hypothetical protein
MMYSIPFFHRSRMAFAAPLAFADDLENPVMHLINPTPKLESVFGGQNLIVSKFELPITVFS